MRLPLAVAGLFQDWLTHQFPDRKEKILDRIRACRSGRLNDSRFGVRMSGEGNAAEMITQIFRADVPPGWAEPASLARLGRGVPAAQTRRWAAHLVRVSKPSLALSRLVQVRVKRKSVQPTGTRFRVSAMATVTPTPPIPPLPLPPPDEVYRLTVDQFDRMVRNGSLDEDEPVELVNGVLVTRMPKNPRHRVATRKTVRAFEGVLPAGWFVQKEESLVIPPGNKWEPDVAIVRSDLEFDSARDANASDCCLVVEVADTNLSRARSEKLSAYAAAGIPVYWIVNLAGGNPPGSGVIEVYSDPDQATGRYLSRADLYPNDEVSVVIGGQEVGRIAVADLLP